MDHSIREDEIDLRPYFNVIAKRWRLILASGLITALVAALVSLALPKAYTATAAVLIRPTYSQLAFDERFITEDSPLDPKSDSHIKALTALAASPAIETAIPASKLQQLAPEDYLPGDLSEDYISISSEGDLLLIEATGSSPEQARDLADTWAETFVSYANKLYSEQGGAGGELEKQVEAANQRYQQAQRAYEEFLSTNRLPELGRQIEALTALLDESQKADREAYQRYLDRIRGLEMLLRDAEALRAHVGDGLDNNFGESLAALALRMRATGGEQLPIELQLSDPGAIASQATLADLDLVIAQIKAQIADIKRAADAIAAALAYEQDASGSLPPDQRAAHLETLRQLRQQHEHEASKERTLEQERNIAFEALQVLRRKLAEQQAAAINSDIRLRLAGRSLLPSRHSSPKLFINTFAGLFIGTLLGMAASFWLEFARKEEQQVPTADLVAGHSSAP